MEQLTSAIHRIFAHLAWADMRAIESARTTQAPDPEALTQLAHVLAAEELWLARLEGRAPEAPVWPELGVEGCEALARDVHARLERHLTGLDASGLEEEVAYHNSAGVPFRSRVVDILLHIAMHGAYHRGHVAAAVRRAGGAPLYTDYIAFVRGGAPATRADAERNE